MTPAELPVHESGHTMSAKHDALPVREVRIFDRPERTADGRYLGGFMAHDVDVMSVDARHWLRALLAGRAAVREVCRETCQARLDAVAAGDLEQAREYASLVTSTPAEADLLLKQAEREATAFAIRYSRVIRAFACELEQRLVVSDAELTQFLKDHQEDIQ